jgi:diadenosine tetraphosphate (Ap4A) HIT family hydrolase
MSADDALSVVEGRWFAVKQCGDCIVPGYLLIAPISPVREIMGLPESALCELGAVQARCVATINYVLKPLRVYLASFGESAETFHCHVFPRTSALTAKYLEMVGSKGSVIRGPIVLDWARDYYRGDPRGNPQVLKIIAALRVAYETLQRP